MEFRLTYQGPLFATQRDPVTGQIDKRADHKHDIRRVFHGQLKRLWQITPFLTKPRAIRVGAYAGSEAHDIATLSAKNQHYGFNFVPLVTEDIGLLCGLDILFLRPDKPGGVVWAGDIDNRIKTLIDCLRIPSPNEEYEKRSPDADDAPFFCLLQDDKLVTKLSIETDQLLEFISPSNMSDVRLVITVSLRPFEMHLGNMEFGG